MKFLIENAFSDHLSPFFMAYLMPLCLLKQGRLLRAARHFVANLMFFCCSWQLLPTADAAGAACVNVGRAVAKR